MFTSLKRIAFFIAVVTSTVSGLSAAGFAASPAVALPAPIDLNRASQAELETLKGVGDVTAKKIIAGRPYKSVDELAGKGIPQRTVEGIRPLVTTGAVAPTAVPTTTIPAKPTVPSANAIAPSPYPSTIPARGATGVGKVLPGQKLNLNTCSEAELEALPGIGPVKARKIVEGRPFNTPEDVMKVPGIKEGIFAKIKDLVSVK